MNGTGIEGEAFNQSSIIELEAFQDGSIWGDMKRLLLDRIEIITDQLIEADDFRKIGFLQGELKSCKTFLDFPQFLIETTKIELEAQNGDPS